MVLFGIVEALIGAKYIDAPNVDIAKNIRAIKKNILRGDKVKYNLANKTTKPDFDYILLSGAYYNEYYLYRANEFEEAYDQLKAEFAKGRYLAVLCDLDFDTRSREWRAQPLFRCSHREDKVFYDPYQETMLHLKWYCDAGTWENPREKWD